ncbi:unnamed protein product [Rotaria sp. Silwood1]|nr:unnamed protein product [Rotaria sp. Silwood1]CAF1265222.1 unnamed protein product [Rotaria sp. Silwood1]CAF3537117.1 unnamed protein product [Rotaria sp. Silwood1]CAF4623489.1 unnamed protein product [Rotaria sp. Silwood1]
MNMLNVNRYIKLIDKYILINIRYLSISKSDLIESSRNIQELLKSTVDKTSTSTYLYKSLNIIHDEYSSKSLATSTKEIYQKNSSKLNSIYIKIENERINEIGDFKQDNQDKLIILLRYIRYLQVAFIYRLITYDINTTLKQTSNSIIHITQHQHNLNENSLSLLCELSFFVYYLSSNNCLSYVKSLLSSTLINKYISNYFYNILSDKQGPIELVNQLSLTFNSILEIPSSSTIDLWITKLINYIYYRRYCSLSIIKYIILIKHSSIDNKNSSKYLSILNEYLIQIGIHQYDLYIICQLLILISSFNYSHELFIKQIIEIIKKNLKKPQDKINPLSDIKLCSRFIYYLCLTDPTNKFQSRQIIVELSQILLNQLDKDKKSLKWIVQAQYGMMLLNIYNYKLSFYTVNQQIFPFIFRDVGVSTWSIPRQLFDINHVLSIDRPLLKTNLLNSKMISFSKKISDQYRSSIRSNQKSYYKFLNELNQFFNNTYGYGTSKIIDTNIYYPYLLFDFLEINLPDNDQFKSIGINTKQRIAVLPILNSMLIKQQRSDGSIVRLLSAHTTMRYRIIEKSNYFIQLIFHDEYIRALRHNTIKTTFETNLALKTIPHYSDKHI